MSEPLTRQEMFDRAVRGLRSQGYRQCRSDVGGCAYTSEDGTEHCAWGWVDTSLERHTNIYVSRLAEENVGVARQLQSDADIAWARALQECHDLASTPERMENKLRDFAACYSLTWPEGES